MPMVVYLLSGHWTVHRGTLIQSDLDHATILTLVKGRQQLPIIYHYIMTSVTDTTQPTIFYRKQNCFLLAYFSLSIYDEFKAS